MKVIGEVLTSSNADRYSRVKVSVDGLWKESELMPSVGGRSLSKGDQVIIDVDIPTSPIITGTFINEAYLSITPTQGGDTLFESREGNTWVKGRLKDQQLIIENSDGSEITLKGGMVTIKAKTITLDGQLVNDHSPTPPNGRGSLCGLPNCLFSGALHTTDKTQ